MTWKLNNNFIISTNLAERRVHVPDTQCPRCEADFYRPKYIYYLGQFPIDYQPKSMPKMSESMAKSTTILPNTFPHGIEFYLLLNNAKVPATDGYKLKRNNPDSPDQVIVQVTPLQVTQFTENTKQEFDRYVKAGNSQGGIVKPVTINDMQCYTTTYHDGSGSTECLGQSKNKFISGFSVYNSLDANEPLKGKSQELAFGGLKVEWFTDKKNINQAQQIDEAIWQLLTAWNVAPKEINDPVGTFASKYKQGDKVTWQVSPQLIVNTTIGEMNKADYQDNNKQFFLGQFPLEYQPKKLTQFDPNNIQQINDINYPFRFNLTTNGAKNVPIEQSPSSVLMPNQVRVEINPIINFKPTFFNHARERIDYYKTLNEFIIKGEKYEDNGLECYPTYMFDATCIAMTNDTHHPQILFRVDKPSYSKDITIHATSVSDLYGGIKVEWTAKDTDLRNWKKIDTAIWRLLETWNVASVPQNTQ